MCGGPGAAAWGFWLSKQQLGSDAWGMAGAGWDRTALSRPAADGRLPVCLEKAGAAHNMVSVRAHAACRMHGNTLPCASRGRGPGTPAALPGSITCTGRGPALHGSQQHRRLWTPFPPGIPALLGASLGSLKLARAAEPPAELRPFRHLRDQPRAGALALRVSRSSRSSSGGPTHLAADTSACTQARACWVGTWRQQRWWDRDDGHRRCGRCEASASGVPGDKRLRLCGLGQQAGGGTSWLLSRSSPAALTALAMRAVPSRTPLGRQALLTAACTCA